MSIQHAIIDIQREAAKDPNASYELRVFLRSGRILQGAVYSNSSTYYLKMNAREVYPQSSVFVETGVTYIPFEAIEQVTPVWFR